MDASQERQGPDLERIGIFKEMSYLQGHLPLKMSFNDASKKGKQMMTTCTKTKKGTQDGYFDSSFPRAFEGEAYMDPIRLRRLHRLEQAQKNRAHDFRYSSPAKKPCGLGSNYGTLADHDKKIEYFSTRPREADPGEPPKKNFFTNPGKKGTGYGYPNLTIGKFPPYFVEEEYETSKGDEESPTKGEEKPFQPYKAGRFHQEYFDPNPYKTDKEIQPAEEEEEEAKAEESEKKPFLRPSPAKKDGGMKAGCLNKFPEHVGEPLVKVDLIPRGVKHYINKEDKMFRPIPVCPKPYPVKSIITKNVQRKVTPQNYTEIKGVVYCKK